MPVPSLQQPIREVIQARLQEMERTRSHTQEMESLVEQIKQAREDLEGDLEKLQALSLELRARCRRNLGEEVTGRYLTWVNAHLRITGALTNGLRRTASMDRVLNQAQADLEEARRRAQEEARRLEARDHQRHVNQLILPTTDDFDEVFGDLVDEEVTHA